MFYANRQMHGRQCATDRPANKVTFDCDEIAKINVIDYFMHKPKYPE